MSDNHEENSFSRMGKANCKRVYESVGYEKEGLKCRLLTQFKGRKEKGQFDLVIGICLICFK